MSNQKNIFPVTLIAITMLLMGMTSTFMQASEYELREQVFEAKNEVEDFAEAFEKTLSCSKKVLLEITKLPFNQEIDEETLQLAIEAEKKLSRIIEKLSNI